MLIAAVTFAARHGYDRHAGQLALALETFLLRRGYWHDLAETQRTALDVATRGGDLAGQARAHHGLGRACALLGSLPQAQAHLSRALDLYERLSDATAEARTDIDMIPRSPGTAALTRRLLTRNGRATCSTRPETAPGTPRPSTTSAGTSSTWASTSRPSLAAKTPSRPSASWATGTARRPRSTASATPISTSATTPGGPPGASRPSPCSVSSATGTTRPACSSTLARTSVPARTEPARTEPARTGRPEPGRQDQAGSAACGRRWPSWRN